MRLFIRALPVGDTALDRLTGSAIAAKPLRAPLGSGASPAVSGSMALKRFAP